MKLALISLITALLPTAAYGQGSKVDTPVFSNKAVYTYTGRPALSPDRQKSVVTRSVRTDKDEDFPTEIVVRIGKEKLTSKIRFGLNAEVLWSPDSSAFAVTGSRDGANGLYWTDVFIINQTGLTKVPLSQAIWHAFGHPVRCGWPEDPNVGAIKWIDGSSRLLVELFYFQSL